MQNYSDILYAIISIAFILIVYFSIYHPKKELDRYLNKGLTSKRIKILCKIHRITKPTREDSSNKNAYAEIAFLIFFLEKNDLLAKGLSYSEKERLFIEALDLKCKETTLTKKMKDCPPFSESNFKKIFKTFLNKP